MAKDLSYWYIKIQDLMKMMQGITKSEMKNIWKELFIEILKIHFQFISLEILWWSLSNITEEMVLAANILGF